MRISGAGAAGDYIHAGDVAAALIALLTCPRPRHPVYNVALGELVTLGELAKLIAAAVPEFRHEEVPPEEADIAGDPGHGSGRWGAYDISRLVADTGWRPHPLAEALADYAAWLRTNPW